ncbi:uncharacterized protein BXZ73DRAFT_99809 [Epithele typhae]|uniref:uncharacterized protein n=1 Tax=Epithele typhae TaxID=378194 RepID=UPI002008A9E4|nr:uncharacterized protein BXZ73DRAFT_99809 [Epithele typhae]KAH9938744.1 hypothetical protein BXZ73DRAFT_99809 [Epithele typhae]
MAGSCSLVVPDDNGEAESCMEASRRWLAGLRTPREMRATQGDAGPTSGLIKAARKHELEASKKHLDHEFTKNVSAICATGAITDMKKYPQFPFIDVYLLVRSRRLSVLIQPNMHLLYNLLCWDLWNKLTHVQENALGLRASSPTFSTLDLQFKARRRQREQHERLDPLDKVL